MAEHVSRPWLFPPDIEVRAPNADEAAQVAALWLAGMADFPAAFGTAPEHLLNAIQAHIRREPAYLHMAGVAIHDGRIVGLCRLARYPGRGLVWWREFRAYASVLGNGAALQGMRRLRAWGWARDVQPDELYLCGWFVREDLRGRGIGRALLMYALEQTRWFGLEKLVADVRQDDANARAVLAHFGFREIGVYQPPRGAHHPGVVRLRRTGV